MGPRTVKLAGCYKLAVSPTLGYVAAVGRGVTVANLGSGQRCFSSRAIANPSHAAFNHAETRIAVKNTSGDLVILDATDGATVSKLRAKGNDEGAPMHYCAADEYLVDGSWNGAIRVRHGDTLKVMEEFCFDNEMITDVSCSADRRRWLFAHQPRVRGFGNFTEPPYLTIWDWPLRAPSAKIDPGFYSVCAASLSPCGSWIASAGYHRMGPGAKYPPHELRMANAAGKLLCTAGLADSGPSRARWSADSQMVGAVDGSGVLIFMAEGLNPRCAIAAGSASDVAFIDDTKSALISTTSKVWVAPL